MFSLFKKKPTIHFYTVADGLDEVMPPVKASKFMPDWWKKIPKNLKFNEIDYKGTVRNCPALPDLWQEGYVIRLWCDLYINVEEDGNYNWRTPDERFTFEHHDHEQYNKWLPDHAKVKLVLKPDCPWRIKTDPGYSVMQLPLTYDFNPIFETLPGVVWTDTHHQINQQLIFKKAGRHLIQRGTPLAVYIPFKRTKYNMKITNFNEESKKLENIFNTRIRGKFRGAYRERQREMKKCPFHK